MALELHAHDVAVAVDVGKHVGKLQELATRVRDVLGDRPEPQAVQPRMQPRPRRVGWELPCRQGLVLRLTLLDQR